MPLKLRILISCITLSLFICQFTLNGQILSDPASLNLLKKGIDDIYNMQFNDARDIFGKLSKSYPEHPVVEIFQALMIYWENYPLIPSSPARQSYEKELRTCIAKCGRNKKEDEPEILLANLCARGLLLLFYADNDLSKDVFPLATSTYRYIRRSFDYTNTYSDFYFFTGIYNYYREAYPDAHPIYKSLAFLFPKGDKEKGLKEMHIASTKAIVLKAESFSFLSSIYQSYENNFEQAYYVSKSLHKLYPSNIEYEAELIKNMLLIKKYDEAENIIISFCSNPLNTYYQAQLSIFKGILREKKYHDYKAAEQYYYQGVRELTSYGEFGNEFAAYAYFGLSRISAANNDRHNQRSYQKKAMDLAHYKKVNFNE